MPNSSRPAKVLTIAGSDSGGAAGLQADLKTWTALGVYGMSVITAVTAQNSVGVDAVHYLPADFVRAQLDTVLSDYGAAAIKTGFIGRADLVEAIAHRLTTYQQTNKPTLSPTLLLTPSWSTIVASLCSRSRWRVPIWLTCCRWRNSSRLTATRRLC